MRPLLWVAGGRDYDKQETLGGVLLPYADADGWTLVTGAAKGADLLAERFWRHHNQPYIGIPANWPKAGRRAGYLRNWAIAYEWSPTKLVAFPGGRGTQMAVTMAEDLEIPIEFVGPGW